MHLKNSMDVTVYMFCYVIYKKLKSGLSRQKGIVSVVFYLQLALKAKTLNLTGSLWIKCMKNISSKGYASYTIKYDLYYEIRSRRAHWRIVHKTKHWLFLLQTWR